MTLVDRLSERLFLWLCSRIRVGGLAITTPAGQRHFFGSEASPIQADLRIADPSLYRELLTQGDWGLGWGYVFQKWESDDPYRVPLVFMLNERLFRSTLHAAARLSPTVRFIVRRSNANQDPQETVRRRTIGQCYDVGNEFYERMLGPSMVYTCAIWPKPDATLEEAQENKLRIVTEKAQIESHHTVLDMGCGFGSLCEYIRKHTGAMVKGITLSRQQVEWARTHYPACEFEYVNYDDISGVYDRIVSVGMGEHVGRANYNAFLQLVSDHLAPGGRFVMHTMCSHDDVLMLSSTERYTSFASVVMPNGDVPSMENIVRASLATGDMRVVHTETFGIHYARTGEAWKQNCIKHKDWMIQNYSEEFYRTYLYSWQMGKAAFETGITLAHVVFEKKPFGSPYTDSILWDGGSCSTNANARRRSGASNPSENQR
jgi:cyclopropane-fatty-acyl-phospholipid synthase